MADETTVKAEKEEFVVAIGLLHEGGKMYSSGQPIRLSAERVKARLADGSILTRSDWDKRLAEEAKPDTKKKD